LRSPPPVADRERSVRSSQVGPVQTGTDAAVNGTSSGGAGRPGVRVSVSVAPTITDHRDGSFAAGPIGCVAIWNDGSKRRFPSLRHDLNPLWRTSIHRPRFGWSYGEALEDAFAAEAGTVALIDELESTVISE